MRNKWFYICTVNLIIIYTVGIGGIAFTSESNRQLFLQLTPLNLIVTTFFTLLFHGKWKLNFLLSALTVFLIGFFTEVTGVKTGAIFGYYHYGSTLGFKLLEVPILIGLNWFLLIYIITSVFNKTRNVFAFGFMAAATMTLLDIFIEPVAIKLDFWQWQNNIIPLRNYVSWFVISFFLFFFFRKTNKTIENRFSLIVLTLQFLFFILLNLLL